MSVPEKLAIIVVAELVPNHVLRSPSPERDISTIVVLATSVKELNVNGRSIGSSAVPEPSSPDR